jgi:RNA binding exosome subunit
MKTLKTQGFSIDTQFDNDRVYINIDKQGKPNGYICVNFNDDGIVLDVFNKEGDIINTCYNFYGDLESETENEQV